MQRIERIFLVTQICFLFILICLPLVDGNAQVYSKPTKPTPTPTPFFQDIIIKPQLSEPISAVVIVERESLRGKPSITATSQAVVTKGAKLKVVPDEATKGWYLAYLEDSPSVYGYIYGNSIKIVKSQKTQESKAKSISKLAPTRSNYCQSPLYCPDIGEVQVALLDNGNKFQKGKFEKTIDWEKRKSTILREIKLKDGKTTADKLYFLYEQGTLTQNLNDPDYDADKELWTFPLVFRESFNETCLPIFSQGSGQVLCLIVKKKLGTELKAFVSMPPSLASANEKNLQIVFVGKIVEPYLWTNDTSSIGEVLSGIHFELEEIICLNPKTGQRWKVDIPTKAENTSKIIDNTKDEVALSDNAALEQFKKTLVTDSMNAEAFLGMGKIYRRRGDYDLAIFNLKTAILWNDKLITSSASF